MKMARSVSAGMASLLAADTASIAPAANPVKVGLVIANFTPTPDLLAADLTIAASSQLTPISGVVGAQLESVDPMTGENVVQIKAPAGGWHWETPVGFVGPVTVFGYALLNDAGTTLWGTQKLDTPVVLNAPNQAHDAGPFTFKFDVNKVH